MEKFIIHAHHHYGWTTHEVEAEDYANACYKAMLVTHDWLPKKEHNHTWALETFNGVDHITVRTVEYKPLALGRYLSPGEYWFNCRVRKGEADDCPKCGGTGHSHYYGWKQCWACGDKELDGKSSGKATQTKAENR